MDITFSSLYTRCQDLSSYEAGKGLADDALYPLIHITERDKMVLLPWAQSGIEVLTALIGSAVEDVELEDETFHITFVPDEHISKNISKAKKPIEEIITCFMLAKWLENKIEDRSKAYMLMFNDLSNALIKRIYRKPQPKLNK